MFDFSKFTDEQLCQFIAQAHAEVSAREATRLPSVRIDQHKGKIIGEVAYELTEVRPAGSGATKVTMTTHQQWTGGNYKSGTYEVSFYVNRNGSTSFVNDENRVADAMYPYIKDAIANFNQPTTSAVTTNTTSVVHAELIGKTLEIRKEVMPSGVLTEFYVDGVRVDESVIRKFKKHDFWKTGVWTIEKEMPELSYGKYDGNIRAKSNEANDAIFGKNAW